MVVMPVRGPLAARTSASCSESWSILPTPPGRARFGRSSNAAAVRHEPMSIGWGAEQPRYTSFGGGTGRTSKRSSIGFRLVAMTPGNRASTANTNARPFDDEALVRPKVDTGEASGATEMTSGRVDHPSRHEFWLTGSFRRDHHPVCADGIDPVRLALGQRSEFVASCSNLADEPLTLLGDWVGTRRQPMPPTRARRRSRLPWLPGRPAPLLRRSGSAPRQRHRPRTRVRPAP